jgi:hypothetical protein
MNARKLNSALLRVQQQARTLRAAARRHAGGADFALVNEALGRFFRLESELGDAALEVCKAAAERHREREKGKRWQAKK